MPRPDPNPEFPCVVLVDQREQLPYSFAEVPADDQDGGGLWRVKVETARLDAGDYSLDGYATGIAIERKSKADIFGTVGQGRDRFIRELERLNELVFAVVVVEAEWSEIFNYPPPHSQLDPKTIWRSVIAWEQRYRNVHWRFLPYREWAEVYTLRVFHRWIKEQAEVSFRKPRVK